MSDSMEKSTASVFERHGILTLLLVNAVLFIVAFLGFEVYLRIWPVYQIDYYTGTSAKGVNHYPYGTIWINSFEHADEEFNLSTNKPRIGYFGDSVNFGVGAGYPYRFSDLVQKQYPEFEHWTLSSGLGARFTEEPALRLADRFRLNYAVYLLNLNDIGPFYSPGQVDFSDSWAQNIRKYVPRWVKGLRAKSYAINYFRFKFKTGLMLLGYTGTNYRSYELWPKKNQKLYEEFSATINQIQKKLRDKSIAFCIVILPYEMQISDMAANTYKGMGFSWEEGFETGSAQQMLKKFLAISHVYDPLPEFVRESVAVGEYFVFDKGDRVDWNHPNRKGHDKLARGFMNSDACPFLKRAARD